MTDSFEIKMPDLTPEQQKRFNLVDELHKLISRYRVDDLTLKTVLNGGVMWWALADWKGYIDLPLLIENGVIVDEPRFQYQPDKSWRDRFPPTAYRLTQHGVDVLNNYGKFIWTGDTRDRDDR